MRQWYEFKNMHDETPELFIYDEIGESFWGEGVTAKNLVGYLNDLKSASKINVRINSPGGSVFDGNAIHNALVNHPADIHVHVDGMALSAASVIAMAGVAETAPGIESGSVGHRGWRITGRQLAGDEKNEPE